MLIPIPHYASIVAILPSYTVAGDATTIFTTNGEKQEIQQSFRTVLHRLVRSLSIDLVALKEKVALTTGKAMFHPLPLAPGLVLCPFKVRYPKIPGDPTLGYINFHAISDIIKNHTTPYHSTIRLGNGIEIPVLWTVTTVKEHLQLAKLVLFDRSYQVNLSPNLTLPLSNLMNQIFHLVSLHQSSYY